MRRILVPGTAILLAVLCAGLLNGLAFVTGTAYAQPPAPEGGSLYLPMVSQGTRPPAPDNGTDRAELFPTGLAVASPLKVEPATPNAVQSASPIFAPAYVLSTGRISVVLFSGPTVIPPLHPERFLTSGADAGCYGPTLMYANHPDGAFGAPGSVQQLPNGDLGIWDENDPVTGNACSAAQLNSRMQAAQEQTENALTVLAALVSAAVRNGHSLPLTGGTLDLTADMNADYPYTFTTAIISRTTTTPPTWGYDVAFTYTEPSTVQEHDIIVTLAHTPGAAKPARTYDGLLTYSVGMYDTGYNCSSTRLSTLNGSLRYNRPTVNSIRLQSRVATFCGHGVDGLGSDGYGVALDGSWSDNFSVFTANFDPSFTASGPAGRYAYAWQAGSGDRASRVLNLGLNDFSPIDGEAYFGYGDRIQDSTAVTGVVDVAGIYCNWAGPGNLPAMQPYAQRQFIEMNTGTGLFVVPSGGSDIRYAPTNSCAYDGSESDPAHTGLYTGTYTSWSNWSTGHYFWYDRNRNWDDSGPNDLTNSGADESIFDVMAITSTTSVTYVMDLMDTTYGGVTYPSMVDAIRGRGYTPPSAP